MDNNGGRERQWRPGDGASPLDLAAGVLDLGERGGEEELRQRRQGRERSGRRGRRRRVKGWAVTIGSTTDGEREKQEEEQEATGGGVTMGSEQQRKRDDEEEAGQSVC